MVEEVTGGRQNQDVGLDRFGDCRPHLFALDRPAKRHGDDVDVLLGQIVDGPGDTVEVAGRRQPKGSGRDELGAGRHAGDAAGPGRAAASRVVVLPWVRGHVAATDDDRGGRRAVAELLDILDVIDQRIVAARLVVDEVVTQIPTDAAGLELAVPRHAGIDVSDAGCPCRRAAPVATAPRPCRLSCAAGARPSRAVCAPSDRSSPALRRSAFLDRRGRGRRAVRRGGKRSSGPQPAVDAASAVPPSSIARRPSSAGAPLIARRPNGASNRAAHRPQPRSNIACSTFSRSASPGSTRCSTLPSSAGRRA